MIEGLKKTLAGAAAIALTWLAVPAGAATITLRDLLDGQTLQAGGLTFQNFRNFQATAEGFGTATAVDPTQVDVSTTTLPSGEVGLTFAGNGQFNSGTTNFPIFDSNQLTTFDYDVLSSGLPVASGTLTLSAEAVGNAGNSQAQVGESVNGQPLLVFQDNNPSTPDATTDHRDFPGVQGLTVGTTITLTGSNGAFARITSFDQTYGFQASSPVPEPATMALAATGGLILAAYTRRRRKVSSGLA